MIIWLAPNLRQDGPAYESTMCNHIDTSASIAAANRALSNLKPEGFATVRGYLDAIFTKWKCDHGKPIWPGEGGLLGEHLYAIVSGMTEAIRLESIQALEPWQCAGPSCDNSIDLFLKIWTTQHTWLEQYLNREPDLFYWFLGVLILDHREQKHRHSVANAGRILLSAFASIDEWTIEESEKIIVDLGTKQALIRGSRVKGGAATAAMKRAQGEETKNAIHQLATRLLQTKSKSEIAGIIRQTTGYSKSTVHDALKSHSTGLWSRNRTPS